VPIRQGALAVLPESQLAPTIHPTTTATTTASAGASTGAANALEAVTAVDRPVAAWLEGYLRWLATVAADDVEELALDARAAAEAAAATTVTFTLVAAHGTAGAAALGLREAARGVEFLVLCAERKFLAAVRTGQSLVYEWHLESLL
jgi:hypothetical protein